MSKRACHLRRLAARARYLRFPAALARYLRLPAALARYLRLPAALARYLRLPVALARYLRLPAARARYLRRPATRVWTLGLCVGPGLFALSLLLAPQARADDGPSVAIVDLTFDASTPPAVRREVEQHLRSGLQRSGCGLQNAAETKKRLEDHSLTAGCRAGPCLVPLGKALAVDRLILGGVSVVGSSYDVLLTALDAASGVALAQVSSRCDVCTFAEVGRRVQQAALELVRQGRRVTANQGRLVIEASQPKAEIWLDGVPLGFAPQSRLAARGWHRIALRVDTQVYRRRVWLTAGSVLRIRGDLRAPRKLQLPQIVPGEVGWPAWMTLGAAVGLVTAGSFLLAMDKACLGEECKDRWNTDTLGLGLFGAGAATAVLTGFLIHYYRRSGARAVWAVAPRRDGLAVVFSRSF